MTHLKNYWYARKYSPLFISIGVGLSIIILVIPVFLINLTQTVKRAETRFVESEIERTENLIQHEMDHLLGKVFVDYLSPLKRNRIKTKMLKRQRQAA